MSDRLTPGQLADYAAVDFTEPMPADAAAVVGRMRDMLVGEIRRLQEERTKYVLVPKWEYELLEQQRERAARAESERDQYRALAEADGAKLLKLQYGCETPESHNYGCPCESEAVAR